jgi:hypothetical protein
MKKIFQLVTILLVSVSTFAQVGINTDKPNTNTGLHVSERMDPASANPDKINGTIIQRYTTAERNTLTLSATDNGLTIYNKTENCYNVWNWNTATSTGSWTSLCGDKQGLVEFTDCSSIKVIGKYITDKPLSSQTVHIDVTLRVKALGSYSYTTTTVNGVTFAAQGTFINLGPQTISLYPVSATSPTLGTFNYSVTVAPTTAGSSGITCNNIPVSFISRATAIMKIVNVSGSDNSILASSGSSYSSTYNWLTGVNTIGSPTTATSYSGTFAIQIVDVTAGNIAELSDALENASGIHVGSNESALNQGFCNIIKEWQESTGGFVVHFADKVAESNLANTLGFYVENGSNTTGITNAGVTNMPQIFSTSTGQPFTIPVGATVAQDGTAAGQITTKFGTSFLQLNNASQRKVGVIDLNRHIVMFGDKFTNVNMNRILVDLYAHFLKTAPIY